MLALEQERHAKPTPIQAEAIPPIIEGRDLLGVAQTGTGKTAAFTLPILHRLSQSPRQRQPRQCRALVLTPTRELAAQVHGRFEAYGARLALRAGLVIGGASMARQKAMMNGGVDVLVATPGRLVDLMNQGVVSLNSVETFVLDEVDQMLDLGFIHAIRSVAVKLPETRQSIFFSATMPPAITRLACCLLRNPVRVRLEAKERLKIDQTVMFIEKNAKSSALIEIVKCDGFTRGLVFARTKHGADKITRALNAAGAQAFAIHGNRSQSQRERALTAFRSGKARILVATDIAARGIDVRGISHVVNYDLPNVPETYVHRIGRTARAGAAGVAVSFCSSEERPHLRSIEKLTRQNIRIVKSSDHARRPSHRTANEADAPRESQLAALSFLKEPPHRIQTDAKNRDRQDHGERGTSRIRRRRHRGAAGRKLSGHPGQ